MASCKQCTARSTNTTKIGTQAEVLASLTSFGIPTQDFPVTTNGSLKATHQLEWIAKQKVKEEELLQHGLLWVDKIDLPANRDVLLGRGPTINQHPGNREFRALIEAKVHEYEAATSPSEKAKITWNIVEEIKAKGRRFLKKDDHGWWMEATDKEARQKVGKALVALEGRATGQLHQQKEESPTSHSGFERSTDSGKRMKTG